ncbi:MAG: hypothetical protein WCF67_18355 [Chitinophagaceae bacterium]
MKNIGYTVLSCLMIYGCTAQKNAPGIYAYKQPVLQGVRPVVIADEKGKGQEQVMKPSISYLIYVESSNANMQVKKVWIKNVPYSVTTYPVQQTPVVMKNTAIMSANADTLVQATSNKVLQIQLGPAEQPVQLGASLQKKISGNELVMHCVINGKDFYYTVPAIKNLPPLALQ